MIGLRFENDEKEMLENIGAALSFWRLMLGDDPEDKVAAAHIAAYEKKLAEIKAR